MAIDIKTPEEMEKMREAGRLAADVLHMITPHVKEGVTTDELDKLCHDYMVDEQKVIPAPLHYRPSTTYPPYPKSICTSVNQQVCHGVPSDRVLKEGDILNIDITIIKDGFHGDTSRMFYVGEPPVRAKKVCEVSLECLKRGIRVVRPGATLGDIGFAVQSYAESQHCSVVREYCGHGIGQRFHEEPQVLHYGRPGQGARLEAGMTFTIEPMINAGGRHVRQMKDGWTVVTKDHSPSAQWEHTVAVTEDGVEILTLMPGDTW